MIDETHYWESIGEVARRRDELFARLDRIESGRWYEISTAGLDEPGPTE